MENILQYLIPLIFIVSFFSMRKKKKKQAAENKKPVVQPETKQSGGVFGKLNKMLEEYYEADLKGAPEKSGKTPGVEDPYDLHPPQREPEPWEDEEAVLQPVTVVTKSAEEIEEEPEQSPPQVMAAIVEPEPVAAKPDISEPDQARKTVPACRFAKIDKAGLRKAIVWSEILGPPKALRDE